MEDTKRLTRDEIREPDAVTTALDHAFLWVRAHPRELAAAFVGLLAVLIAIIAGVSWSRARDARASSALASLASLAARPVGEAVPAGPGQPAEAAFPDPASRDNAILSEADALLAEHGSTRAARGARMLKAQALARRGRYAEAAALYGEVAGAVPTDALGASAALARASARAGAGEAAAAIEDLKALAASGNPNVPKDLALEWAARLAEQESQAEVAARLYQRIIDEVADSPLAAQARAKVEELKRGVDGAAAAP